jgi:predicted PurR-regulated permease PerM
MRSITRWCVVAGRLLGEPALENLAMAGEKTAGFRDAVTGERGPRPPVYGAAQVTPASSPELKSLLSITVAAISVAALYFAQDVLIPIMLAVMLSFVLSPLVDILQRLRLWRAPAVILAVLATLGVIGLLGTVIAGQAASLSDDAPRYAQTIEAKIEGVQGYAEKSIAQASKMFGLGRHGPQPRGASARNLSQAARGNATAAGEARRPVLVEIAPQEATPAMIARSILAPVVGPLETTIIVLVVAIFVLLQKEDLRDRFIRVLGSHDLHRTTVAMHDAGKRLSNYFLSQLLVNTVFGIVIATGLWGIGLPSPAMWGILAGLLRFVPYIGSFIAALAPMALGAAIEPGWAVTIYVALLFLVIEPLTGYVVEPLLYGHSTGLSPVSVIISAVFWTWLWGPIGLIMSTPLTLCLVVLGRHVKSLEFFDVLLGDRPALSPVETFYQRILARNPDAALVQAEQFLVVHQLIDYYDEVVLPALRLAAEDEARGTLDHARSTEILDMVTEVIADLGDYGAEDADMPEPSPIPGSGIVCVAARGKFDLSVTAMVVQLLEQRGVSARLVSLADMPREAVASLASDGAATIVLSYLDPSSAPVRLIRRLRERAPHATILVGPVPAQIGNIAAISGVDRYCRSFQDMMGAIVTGGGGRKDTSQEPAGEQR